MALDFYNLIQLSSQYFTDDGLNTGTRYISQVTGLHALTIDSSVQVIKTLSGKPYVQKTPLLGKSIVISFENIYEADYSTAKTTIQTAVTNGTTIALNITDGPYGDFNLTVVPDENPIQFSGEYENGRIKKCSLHLLTT